MEAMREEEHHVSLGDDRDDGDVNNAESMQKDASGVDEDVAADCLKSILDLTADDIMGLEFESEEAAVNFYERYAQCYGFGVRKDTVYRGSFGSIVTRQLVCNKQGERHKKYLNRRDRVRRAKAITRVSCPARIRVSYEHKLGKWKVIYFEMKHSHGLLPVDKVHLLTSFRHINDSDKALISSLKLHGFRSCSIMGLLKGQMSGRETLTFTKKDLYNFIDKEKRIRVGNGDAVAALSYLQAKAESDPMFFSKFSKSSDERLENLFWADGVSRLDYNVFGDVIAFDSTYKKNKYNKPLVIFVGYNHHGQTTIFGCALVIDETIESYKWVLEAFSECMFQKHPKAIVTDGCPSMREAIRVVFPNCRHRLCAWHIQQNALDKVKNSDFLEDFNTLVYANFTEEKFERFWSKVTEKYGLADDDWVKKTYEIKHMWASAYMRDKFFAGIRTTSMCEGVNSFIKSYVQCKNSMLDFIHNFERAVKDYRQNELESDFNTMISEPVFDTSLPHFERDFSKHFTRNMFYEVKIQIKSVGSLNILQRTEVDDVVMLKMHKFPYERREYVVLYDRSSVKFVCDCGHFDYSGIPCSHIICAMRNEKISEIPPSLICKRWSRSAKVEHMNQINDAGNDAKKLAMLRRAALSAACNVLSAVASENVNDFTEVLEDIYKLAEKVKKRRHGTSNIHNGPFMIADPAMVKTKGAPRKKKGRNKKRLCSRCRRSGHTIKKCPEYLREVGSRDVELGDSSVEIDGNNIQEEVEAVVPNNGRKVHGSARKDVQRGKEKDNNCDQRGKEFFKEQTEQVNVAGSQYYVPHGMNMMNGFSLFPQFHPAQIFQTYPSLGVWQQASSSQVPNFMSDLNEVERKAKIARLHENGCGE